MVFPILNLPRHVVLIIFDKLDERQLINSRRVCRKWKSIVDDEGLWLKKFLKLQKHNPHWSDSQRYSWKSKYYYSRKWLRADLSRTQLLDMKKKYIPWLQVCPIRPNQDLWLSWGSCIDRISNIDLINEYPPSKRQRPSPPSSGFHGHLKNDDFCRFAVSRYSDQDDDRVWLAAGTRSGLLYYLLASTDRLGRFTDGGNYIQAHSGDLHCVDLLSSHGLAVTGSRDRTVKVWNVPAFTDENSESTPQLRWKFELGDRAWCLKTNQLVPGIVAVGSAACWNDCAPITLLDIESGRMTSQLGNPCKRGAGVLDLSFVSENTLLAGGYDSVVRLWDLRSQQCVWSWEETYNSSIYCLTPDSGNALFVGTSRYGLVWLLDMRWPRAMQNYYVGSTNRPVYSMAATTTNLHVSLDSEIWSLECQQPEKSRT